MIPPAPSCTSRRKKWKVTELQRFAVVHGISTKSDTERRRDGAMKVAVRAVMVKRVVDGIAANIEPVTPVVPFEDALAVTRLRFAAFECFLALLFGGPDDLGELKGELTRYAKLVLSLGELQDGLVRQPNARPAWERRGNELSLLNYEREREPVNSESIPKIGQSEGRISCLLS